MTDPLTIAGIGGALWASKDLVNKLLGPTADYLGESTRDVVKRAGDVNLTRIFNKALDKLGDNIEESAVVSPRVLKRVWDEGRFIDNELVAEYYGGALAASRGEGTDECIPFLALLEQMSSSEIRLHYEVYTCDRIAVALASACGVTSAYRFDVELGGFDELELEGLTRHGLLFEKSPVSGYQTTLLGSYLFKMAHGLSNDIDTAANANEAGLEVLETDIVPLYTDSVLHSSGLDIFIELPTHTAAYVRRGRVPRLYRTIEGFILEEPKTLEFPVDWLHGARLFVRAVRT